MGRFVKWLFVLGLVLGALYLTSYVGARATVGKLLGPDAPNMGERTIQFAFKGTEDLPGSPRVWVFTYRPTAIPGAREVRIYVSPRGTLLETRPRDLGERLDEIQRSREP